jgi:hypothetical protein
MQHEAGVSVGGYMSDRFTWSDGACANRSAALVRNDAADPGGSHGGYLRQLVWNRAGTNVTATGTGVNGWNGFGYAVNHYASSADTSIGHTGTYSTLLSGAHHAMHEFKVRMNPGGPVDATIHWFFATGRTHPVISVSYDATPAGPNAVASDTRTPYGDLGFEGADGPVGGVEWGDKYRFTTTGAGPETTADTWDYTQPNVVPFVRMWSQGSDAEMGLVQTQTWEQHPAGGDYGAGLLGLNCWGKTNANKGASCSPAGWTMPQDWMWPFQLNQYELPYTNTSHRLAWGATYGAIGQSSYSAFGKTLTGYPTVSYAVFMVVGPKSTQAVQQQVTAAEHLLSASVTGATYDPMTASWTAPAGTSVTMAPSAGTTVETPVFHFTGYSAAAPSMVTLSGHELNAGTDYFATVDAATQSLWITLNGTVTGSVTLHAL